MFSRASLCAAAVATSLGLAACATLRGRTEGPTVPVAIEIQNNLSVPTDLTVYVVTRSGARTLLGGVPPAATRTFTFKPVSFSEPYRLLATRSLRRAIESQVFIVGSDMTGRIIWMLYPNIVGFEDMGTDSAAAPDTTRTPATTRAG